METITLKLHRRERKPWPRMGRMRRINRNNGSLEFVPLFAIVLAIVVPIFCVLGSVVSVQEMGLKDSIRE